MYYETKEGDNEIKLLCSIQEKIAEENEASDDEVEIKTKNSRKCRRTEASMLEEEYEIDRLSNVRPKRAAAMRVNEINNGHRKIDEFISKKRSPRKSLKSVKIGSILPSIPINDCENCPICDRLISNDILEIHTNACLINNSEAGKELIEKSKQRAKTDAEIKDALFQRITRQNVASHLIRNNSETTTCPTCGMQMTVSRLENQHKTECLKR
ncbi:unnamed protein product [Rotaria magnacalcarata]|uniref:UBZ4-type domain-containing protein n=1 Tax=Rotaria magnacalcarata TaxID=392030 RepID=A0A819L0Y3_9BILA|nr:unnamed protein product [Rotaria magnacalcarata]CAF3953338.1 unnamed protein product [Rotaria magnacalcarata]